jgi:hypothetical protein
MEQHRNKLLLGLIGIFVIAVIVFLLNVLDVGGSDPSGAAVSAPDGHLTLKAGIYFPGILFMGTVILVMLRKKE